MFEFIYLNLNKQTDYHDNFHSKWTDHKNDIFNHRYKEKTWYVSGERIYIKLDLSIFFLKLLSK